MKRIFPLILILCVITVGPALGQLEHGCEIFTSGGRYYQTYTIGKGETLFSVTKKFQIEQGDLFKLNPQASKGLKTGMKIKVPVSIVNDKNHESFRYPVNEEVFFVIHVVGKGETLYSISKKYNVTTADLVRYNPQAEKGVRDHERIRVPVSVAGNEKPAIEKEQTGLGEYVVKPGETYFSIAKLFGMTVDDLKRLNPDAGDQLQSGYRLKIPNEASGKNGKGTAEKQQEPSFVRYIIKKGDNFTSMRRRFGITKDELIALNPALKDGMKLDAEIILPESKKTRAENLSPISKINPEPTPKQADSTTKDPGKEPEKHTEAINKPHDENEDTGRKPVRHPANDTFNIALMMPFYFEKNKEVLYGETSQPVETSEAEETVSPDTLENQVVEAPTVYHQSKSALNFYEGFLLALDTLQKSGVNVKLKVYDTEQKVSKLLNDRWLLEANLIVGPRDVKMQPAVSSFSAKNHVPMVAPFLSNDSLVKQNPFFIQHTPAKSAIIGQMANFVSERFIGQNIVVLTTGDYKRTSEWAMVVNLKDLLTDKSHLKKGGHYTEVPFTGGGDQGHIQIRGAMREGMENVVMVPLTESRQQREATLARAVNALQVLSKNFNITLVGFFDYPRLESINTEFYHRLNLHYLTPTHVEYTEEQVNRFVRKYRDDFKGEPDQYSFRGYDIALFFGEAYRLYGKDFIGKIPTVKTDQLQDRFRFKKLGALDGYINQSLFVVNFNREWEVVKAGEIIGDKVVMFRPLVVPE